MTLKPPVDPNSIINQLYGFVNAVANGARGDGVTDNTSVVNALSATMSAAGGGTIVFDSGTFIGNFIARPRVRFAGQGAATILKARSGSNDDVIKGENFATLTGKVYASGDYARGAYECEFADLVIDGNKSTMSSGYGVRVWGRAPRFTGIVTIRNCKSGGLWTEFTDVDSFADSTQVLEGVAHSLNIQNCDGHGWTHRGPHDFVVHECQIWQCTGWAVRVEQTSGGYNGGVYFRHLNFYLCSNGAFVSGSSLFNMHGGAITGTTGTGLELATTTGGARVRGVIIAGFQTGAIVRGSSHQIDAQVDNNTVTGIQLDTAINCRINMHGAGNQNVIDVVSEAGPNSVQGLFDVASGKTLKTGAAFNSAGYYMLKAYGSGGSSTVQQFPSATLTAAGWSPVLAPSNGTMIPGGTATLTYGATVTPDASAGIYQRVTVTNGTAFTIAAPTNGKTWPLTFEIVNSSGGAMGAITWNGAYLLAGAFTNPANTKRRTITFQEIGGSWVEVSRAAADI